MAKYINIEGNQVIDLTPDYNRPLALVDLTVLRMLTDLLPKADFGNIRHDLRTRIMNTNNLVDLVEVRRIAVLRRRHPRLVDSGHRDGPVRRQKTQLLHVVQDLRILKGRQKRLAHLRCRGRGQPVLGG